MIVFNSGDYDDMNEFYKDFMDQIKRIIGSTTSGIPNAKLLDQCELFDKERNVKFVIKLYIDQEGSYKFTKEYFDNTPENKKRLKELEILLKTAVEKEDYHKAAEYKREIDELMKKSAENEHRCHQLLRWAKPSASIDIANIISKNI